MEYKEYTCFYQHEGSTWGFELKATSFEDAAQRLKAIGYGEVQGVLVAKVPAMPGTGVFVRLLCWLKNRKRPA